ncbi:hypothetical protein [Ensifer adhaerens]|uniref:hypothetical protein n=1 Tax=Ensifer adhaerens TaxID=106592 RepID=UPI001F2B1F96|nr:hypothetical protein [Ensifer adhaerens]
MGIETAPAMKGSTMTSLKIMFATGAIVGAVAGQVAACPQDGHKAPLGASRKEIVETPFNVIRYAGYLLDEKALLIAQKRMSLFDAGQAPAA